MSGVDLIAAERARQMSEEGWSAEHDDTHENDELALAAMAYGHPRDSVKRHYWPFEADSFKPSRGDSVLTARIEDLAKAGALIAAEIDRLERRLPQDD